MRPYHSTGSKIYFTGPDGHSHHRATAGGEVAEQVARLLNNAYEAKCHGKRDLAGAFTKKAIKLKGFRWVKD